jgi:hypothetical protein
VDLLVRSYSSPRAKANTFTFGLNLPGIQTTNFALKIDQAHATMSKPTKSHGFDLSTSLRMYPIQPECDQYCHVPLTVKPHRRPRGTGPDARENIHDDYDYKKLSFFYEFINKTVGPVPNTVIWNIVKFIEETLGPLEIRYRMAKRRLPVAYHYLDEHQHQIPREIIIQAIGAAMKKWRVDQVTSGLSHQ